MNKPAYTVIMVQPENMNHQEIEIYSSLFRVGRQLMLQMKQNSPSLYQEMLSQGILGTQLSSKEEELLEIKEQIKAKMLSQVPAEVARAKEDYLLAVQLQNWVEEASEEVIQSLIGQKELMEAQEALAIEGILSHMKQANPLSE